MAGLADIAARLKARSSLMGDRADVRPRTASGASMPPVAAWDKRPGDLEATRDPARAAVVAVAARHQGDGWKVALLRGGLTLDELDAEAARRLAGELNDMADLVDGKRW